MSRHGEYEGRSSGIGSGKARHLRPDRRLRGVDGFRTKADLHSMPANASERSRRGFGDPGRFSQGIPDAGALTRNRNRGTCQMADAHCRQHVPEAAVFERAPAHVRTAEDLLAARDLSRRFTAALEKLSPRQRAVFVLRHEDGKSLVEIGELLNLDVGTVKGHMARALKKLREELRDLYGC
ncbi:MAG: hypothetical protein DMG10_31260 [Acidobacteria bacterium]|nr:MAG: hypothetical protein DMG10_31260 [Acidobacteriota bacterium]